VKLALMAVIAATTMADAASARTKPPADIYTEVFTGTVASGVDTFGDFGVSGANLTGDAYKETFTFNDSLGTLTKTSTGEKISGGSSLTATLTIDGKSYTIVGNKTSYVENSGSNYEDLASGKVAGGTATLEGDLNDSRLGLPTYFGEHYAPIEVGQNGVTAPASYNFFQEIIGGCSETLKLVPTSAAPEPTTWALMFGGVALIGASLRVAKRRRAARMLAA
jgi:hypothetical protein